MRRALRGVAYAMGLWLALVSAALVADATRVAPVEKVLTMLKDLTAKSVPQTLIKTDSFPENAEVKVQQMFSELFNKQI